MSLIIRTDFRSFTVNEDKLQNLVNLKFSVILSICDFGQYLKMTKKLLNSVEFIKRKLVNNVYN